MAQEPWVKRVHRPQWAPAKTENQCATSSEWIWWLTSSQGNWAKPHPGITGKQFINYHQGWEAGSVRIRINLVLRIRIQIINDTDPVFLCNILLSSSEICNEITSVYRTESFNFFWTWSVSVSMSLSGFGSESKPYTVSQPRSSLIRKYYIVYIYSKTNVPFLTFEVSWRKGIEEYTIFCYHLFYFNCKCIVS